MCHTIKSFLQVKMKNGDPGICDVTTRKHVPGLVNVFNNGAPFVPACLVGPDYFAYYRL